MRTAMSIVIGVSVLLFLDSFAMAHHSGAMFDHTQLVKYRGVVKTWEWTNPHSFLTLLIVDANGLQQEVKFEIGSPSTLFRSGWRIDSFKSGDNVSLYAYPRKDASAGGMMVTATTAQGAQLQWLPSAQTQDARVVN